MFLFDGDVQNGVRGLMLDMYDFDNDIWLCHSFRGQCFNFTAFVIYSLLFLNFWLLKFCFII